MKLPIFIAMTCKGHFASNQKTLLYKWKLSCDPQKRGVHAWLQDPDHRAASSFGGPGIRRLGESVRPPGRGELPGSKSTCSYPRRQMMHLQIWVLWVSHLWVWLVLLLKLQVWKGSVGFLLKKSTQACVWQFKCITTIHNFSKPTLFLWPLVLLLFPVENAQS